MILRTDLHIMQCFIVEAANAGQYFVAPGAGEQGLSGVSVVRSAWCVQQTQIGKHHTRCGHGFTAENANALHDRLSGRSVKQVGTGNALSGPDRLCAGVAIQTKYCALGSKSIKAAFESDGRYRYPGQVLEVPPEQYDEVVAAMAQAITEGRVEDTTNPGRAGDLVRKGSVSYQQSRRIARPGNRDSLFTSAGRKAVGTVARVSLGKPVARAAAVNHCSRLMRSSLIGGAVTMAVGSAPNIARAVGKMTWAQVGRCGVEDVASTAAGMRVWTLCFTVGSIACGIVMTGGATLVEATLIGTAGAFAAGKGARHVAHKAVDAAVGKDVAPARPVVVPAWLAARLVAQEASAAVFSCDAHVPPAVATVVQVRPCAGRPRSGGAGQIRGPRQRGVAARRNACPKHCRLRARCLTIVQS